MFINIYYLIIKYSEDSLSSFYIRRNMNIKDLDLTTPEIIEFLKEIGLLNPKGNSYKEKKDKLRQIIDYIVHLEKIINKLSKKKIITILDNACGKAYLSFFANYYFTRIKERKVRFICVDYNEKVINRAKNIKESVKMENIYFYEADIKDFIPKINPDIVYSLHACDTATDMSIAKGIILKAKYVLNVSCCQKTTRHQLKKHPLKSITRHGVYRERLVDMISDSMRGLLLEACGYKMDIFDFVPSSQTPKNIMVRSNRVGISNEKAIKALEEFNYLNSIFHIKPVLYEMIRVELDQLNLNLYEIKKLKIAN